MRHSPNPSPFRRRNGEGLRRSIARARCTLVIDVRLCVIRTERGARGDQRFERVDDALRILAHDMVLKTEDNDVTRIEQRVAPRVGQLTGGVRGRVDAGPAGRYVVPAAAPGGVAEGSWCAMGRMSHG